MPAQHQTRYIKTRNGQEVTTVTLEGERETTSILQERQIERN
jgi:hypothetical protein